MYRLFFKRLIDILVGLMLFVFLWPVMLITAIAIYIEDPGPVIFKQDRLGKDGKVFKMLRFRSMKQNSEHTGSGVYSGKGDPRVTKVGRIIRATSIDELIQAVHLINGQMSLIGPRPPLTYHPWPIEQYTKEQLHMFDVRPGITGWAQVNGRKKVPWDKRIELNCWYADNVSFALDLKIFFLTIAKVFTNADNVSEGATVPGKDATPEK
jgi:lipopolysaccharide/colanic/teichoic acid biosynthesis glycosyltransferase